MNIATGYDFKGDPVTIVFDTIELDESHFEMGQQFARDKGYNPIVKWIVKDKKGRHELLVSTSTTPHP